MTNSDRHYLVFVRKYPHSLSFRQSLSRNLLKISFGFPLTACGNDKFGQTLFSNLGSYRGRDQKSDIRQSSVVSCHGFPLIPARQLKPKFSPHQEKEQKTKTDYTPGEIGGEDPVMEFPQHLNYIVPIPSCQVVKVKDPFLRIPISAFKDL